MRSSLLAALLLLILGVGVGCSATGQLTVDEATVPDVADAVDPTGLPDPTTSATENDPAPTTQDVPGLSQGEGPALGAPASDRIVVATSAGQVYLIDPDGQERLDLSQDTTGAQPVWSPDGRRIAWSQRDASGFSIASANADGTERRTATTLFSGYFGYWSPTSLVLGFLGNASPGTGLVIDAGSGTSIDAVVDSDTFYYFSWNPDGTRWIVHSGSGLRIVSLDGTRTPLQLEPAGFRAPIWAPDGSILLAVRIDTRNVIVRLDPETGDTEELLEVGDVSNFVLDPTGRYLAIESLVFEDGQSDPADGITISTGFQSTGFQSTGFQSTGFQSTGSQSTGFQSTASQPGRAGAEVLVYDLTTGVERQVFREQTGGLWWSPDGTTLAMLVQEEGPDPVFAQWLLWRADESFRTERFRVTAAFAALYLPFYDQFAQSVTPWSPDSSRFVYSAIDEQGDAGIFVQPARPDTAAQRISDDDGVAFWSPT